MATPTANYGFVKDAPTQNYDVNVVNANLDSIDAAIKARQNSIDAKDAAMDTRMDLVEAADTTVIMMKAAPTAQAFAVSTLTNIPWAAATRNQAAMTKTSGVRWTFTKTGFYLISLWVTVTAFQDVGTRAYISIATTKASTRSPMAGENQTVASGVFEADAGDFLDCNVWVTQACSLTVASTQLHVVRLGV
jgi:hypothetical protein